MLPRLLATAALMLAIAAGAVGPSASAGAAQTPYTIAYVTAGLHPFQRALARGARAAVTRLGDRFVLAGASDTSPLAPVYQRLIAQHVDAIFTDGYDPSLTPVLNKVRAAGIELLSAGDDIAARRTVWVSQSDAVVYAEALADALASQLHGEGEYAIVGQQGQYPIADEWERIVKRYLARAYPHMKLEGIVAGTGAGDPAEAASVAEYIRAHPGLRGLCAVVPTEAWMAAEGILRAHAVGKVFSAGNGGASFGAPLPGFVRRGAAELVYAGDPVKTGYLTVWAAHYLVSGHSFKPGLYHVGGPIGNVWYHAAHQELRLGQPLTITRANVGVYADRF